MPGPSSLFFQAEDGIRDVAVTGVQTCALPILLPIAAWLMRLPESLASLSIQQPFLSNLFDFVWRSEEHTSELQSRLHLVCRLLLEKIKVVARRGTVGYGHSVAPRVPMLVLFFC